MKNGLSTELIVDSIFAFLQTLIFTIVPEINSETWRILTYLFLGLGTFAYVFFLKNLLIDKIDGMRFYSPPESIYKCFHETVVETILSLLKTSANKTMNIVEQFQVVYKWRKCAKFITNNFLSIDKSRMVNVVGTRHYSIGNAILKTEVIACAQELINIYHSNSAFRSNSALLEQSQRDKLTCYLVDLEEMLKNADKI